MTMMFEPVFSMDGPAVNGFDGDVVWTACPEPVPSRGVVEPYGVDELSGLAVKQGVAATV
jgi:hypothetical protein